MLEPSGPQSVGEILDAAFRLVMRHAALLVGLAALVQVPLAFAAAPYAADPTSATPASLEGGPLLVMLAASVASVVVWPAQVFAIGELAAHHEVGLDQAMGAGLRRALAVVATWIVIAALALAWLVPIGLVVGASHRLPLAVVAAILGALVASGLYVALRLFFLIEVVVLERRAAWGALRRAWRLAGGHVWRVGVVTGLAAIVSSTPIAILQVFVRGSPVGYGVVVGLGFSLALAFTTAVSVLLYLDVRRCKGELVEEPPSFSPLV